MITIGFLLGVAFTISVTKWIDRMFPERVVSWEPTRYVDLCED